jgi:hypothetical protein
MTGPKLHGASRILARRLDELATVLQREPTTRRLFNGALRGRRSARSRSPKLLGGTALALAGPGLLAAALQLQGLPLQGSWPDTVAAGASAALFTGPGAGLLRRAHPVGREQRRATAVQLTLGLGTPLTSGAHQPPTTEALTFALLLARWLGSQANLELGLGGPEAPSKAAAIPRRRASDPP